MKWEKQIGDGGGTRTHDRRIMIPLLYQLSYSATSTGYATTGRFGTSRAIQNLAFRLS